MAGQRTPNPEEGKTKRTYVIECVNARGRYPKLLVSESRPGGLAFRNGRATINDDEFKELSQNKTVWKRQIDLLGKLPQPGRLQAPVVVRHAGPQGESAHKEVVVNETEEEKQKREADELAGK